MQNLILFQIITDYNKEFVFRLQKNKGNFIRPVQFCLPGKQNFCCEKFDATVEGTDTQFNSLSNYHREFLFEVCKLRKNSFVTGNSVFFAENNMKNS